MKNKIILLLCFTSLLVFAQNPEQQSAAPAKKWFDKSNILVGGNMGLQIGTSTFVDVSPMVGYKVTERFIAGLGATYQYFRYNSKTYKYQASVYGGRVFGRYFITDNFFAHTEYEVLNLQAFDLYPVQRVNVGSLLGGVGYMQRWSANSGFVASILYNFTESYYSPYINPIIRVGFVIGL